MTDVRPEDLERQALPTGWEWAELLDLAEIKPNAMTDGPFGSKLKSAHYVAEGVRVVRLGNLGVGNFKDDDQSFITHEHFETLRKHEVRPGDLLIAALAEPVGRCCEAPPTLGVAIVKADCIKFSAHPDVARSLIMHWLNSPRGRANSEALSHGIGRLRMNLGNMRALPVPVPPLNEQRRIVDRIEALQARSTAAKEALDAIPPLLEKFRQSVLAAAFRGDLTAAWRAANPDVEPASELLDRIRAERRTRWIADAAEKARARAEKRARKAGKPWTAADNEKALEKARKQAEKKYQPPEPVDPEGLPELPDGWCWASVDELCASVTDGDHQAPPKATDGVPFVVIGNLTGGTVALDDCRYVPRDYYRGLDPSRRPTKGDVLYTVTGSYGIAVEVETPEPFCVQRHVAILRPLSEIGSGFLRLAMSTPAVRSQADRVATGTAQKTVPLRGLRGMVVALPPVSEAESINDALERHLSGAKQVSSYARVMTDTTVSLESSILAKAFRGELVPQDPDDEPASVLLDRIRAEREAAEAEAKAAQKAARAAKAAAKKRGST